MPGRRRRRSHDLGLFGFAEHWPPFRITPKGGTIGRGNVRGEGAGARRTKVGFSSSPASPASRPYQATTYVGTFGLACVTPASRPPIIAFRSRLATGAAMGPKPDQGKWVFLRHLRHPFSGQQPYLVTRAFEPPTGRPAGSPIPAPGCTQIPRAPFKRRPHLRGGWGRRPEGDAPRPEAGALGAR